MTDELPFPSLAELRARASAKWRMFPDDVLPMFVAEMDVDLAPPVAAALTAAVRRSDTGYPLPGTALPAAVAGFAARRWRWTIDPERITTVADVGVGVLELLRVLVRPGDPVVISPPVYPPFFAWPPAAGARVVEVPLQHGADGWRLDLDAIERAFATHPAAYLLCNPHNPVGRVHSREELTALARLARIYRVPIVADEIHAPLVLPGATFTPFLTVPGGADVGISLVSASKAWNLAGLKCASIVTASPATDAIAARLPADVHWHAGHFGVLASIAALTEGEPWLDRLVVTLDARRGRLATLLRDRLPDVRWTPPEATFLAWLDCSAIGADNSPRELFLDVGRVALEPGLAFGAPGAGHVRLNYGTSAEVLDEATRRMAAAAGRR